MGKKIVLRVRDLEKSFRLPLDSQSSIKGRLINLKKIGYERQEVLKGVSFDVYKGDFLGVVGRNGSGKSTLLKLLSGIYSPDRGSIDVYGKLTPFIELGVGFNPELSGRDNVFLNGALLGFSRAEMEEMYEDIVTFAELERFMDQKLKNYSSGMQVRLAFSIAIRANTSILVLDEVLAVGDEAFQRKCFEYFKQIKRQKKTVILVTHDMASVRRFCNRAIMLDAGRIAIEGDPNEVANAYSVENIESSIVKSKKESKDKPYIKTSIETPLLSPDDTLCVRIEYYSPNNQPVSFGISIIDEASNRTTSVIDDGFFIDDEHVTVTSTKKGVYTYDYTLPLKSFNSRNFEVTATLFMYNKTKDTYEPVAYTVEESISKFCVRESGVGGGLLNIKGSWEKR